MCEIVGNRVILEAYQQTTSKELTVNTKQIKVAQTVTKQNWIEWKTCKYIGGELIFTMDEIGDTVFIQGSNNTDSKGFFDKHFIVQFFIGPRGGVKVKVCN
jgi:hypothetical protein